MSLLYEVIKLLWQIMMVCIAILGGWQLYANDQTVGLILDIILPGSVMLSVVYLALYLVMGRSTLSYGQSTQVNIYLIVLLLALILAMAYIYIT